MNNNLQKLLKIAKKPKTLMILGIAGIVLIAISSIFPFKKVEKTCDSDPGDFTYKYKKEIEEDLKGLVFSITGDKDPTVVVTLENSMKYSYADSTKSDSSNSSSDRGLSESESKTLSYITVKSSEGGEVPLIVTEIMPQVRGVSIICVGGDDEVISEKIENAVISALNISSNRVYIAGGNIYEKR